MIIERLEMVMVRVQNATGIPRWQMAATVWRVWAVIILLWGLVETRSPASRSFAAFIAISTILVTFLTRAHRRAQREADRTQMVVPNELRDEMPLKLMRIIAWLLLPHIVVALLRGEFLKVLDDCAYCVGSYLFSFNTWPMQGPTIWEQMKSLLKFRRTAEGHG